VSEFDGIYKLPVAVVPTNRTIARVDNPDVVFRCVRGAGGGGKGGGGEEGQGRKAEGDSMGGAGPLLPLLTARCTLIKLLG